MIGGKVAPIKLSLIIAYYISGTIEKAKIVLYGGRRKRVAIWTRAVCRLS